MPALRGDKKKGGGQGGEEEGLVQKETQRRQTRASEGDSEAGREACELHINPVGSGPSQQALFSCSRKTPYRTMETQRNGPAMPQTPHYDGQRLY